MKKGIFVAGNDTNVGKTWVACALLRNLRRAGVDAVGFKPFACGDRLDAERLATAADGVEPVDQVNPVWFRAPLSPFAASLVEQRHVDTALAEETFHALAQRHDCVIVEGVGGWEVPITQTIRMSDFAIHCDLPVLLVAADRLGVQNHTILTINAIRRAGLPVLGVLLNQASPPLPMEMDPSPMTNQAVLEMLLDVPVWGPLLYECEDLPAEMLPVLDPP